MDYLGDNDEEKGESGEQQTVSVSVALDGLKSPSPNDTTDNITTNVISSSPRNDTDKDFDWDKEPLEISDISFDLYDEEESLSQMRDASKNPSASASQTFPDFSQSTSQASSGQSERLSQIQGSSKNPSASAAQISPNLSQSTSQASSGQSAALKRGKTTQQIKNLIGSFKTTGLHFHKLKRVYLALYDEPIDLEILLVLIISGQVVIIGNEKLAMRDTSFHKPLSPI